MILSVLISPFLLLQSLFKPLLLLLLQPLLLPKFMFLLPPLLLLPLPLPNPPTGPHGSWMTLLPRSLTPARPPPPASKCSLFPLRPHRLLPTSPTLLLPLLPPALPQPPLSLVLSHLWLVGWHREQNALLPAIGHRCVRSATTSSGVKY